jgi:hypothetical protein
MFSSTACNSIACNDVDTARELVLQACCLANKY